MSASISELELVLSQGYFSSVQYKKKMPCIIATFPNNFVRIHREKTWQMEIQSLDKTFLLLKHIWQHDLDQYFQEAQQMK